MLLALLFALAIALGMAAAAYALTNPQGLQAMLAREMSQPVDAAISAGRGCSFFTIFAFSFLIWATIPLTTGTSRQFDPGHHADVPDQSEKTLPG